MFDLANDARLRLDALSPAPGGSAADGAVVVDGDSGAGAAGGSLPGSRVHAVNATGLGNALRLNRQPDDAAATLEDAIRRHEALLAKNPLEDVKNLRSVVLTIKRGKQFPRADYGQ